MDENTGPEQATQETGPTPVTVVTQTTPPADRDRAAEKAARAPLPDENTGSGQFAVYDETLGQYVSGVGDEDTANGMKRELEDVNGVATKGHKLTVREV